MEWAPSSNLPDWANYILASSPGAAAPDSSLTAIFRQQSHGNLDMTGDVIGYRTMFNENYYLNSSGYLKDSLITHEVLNNISSKVNYNFLDGNNDGYVDMVNFVFRSFSGTNGLLEKSSGYTRPISGSIMIHGKEIYLASWNRYQVIDPILDGSRLLMHEIGHQIFNIGPSHLRAIQNNNTPSKPPLYNYPNWSYLQGYALMTGRTIGRGHAVSNNTVIMSAYERDKVSSISVEPNERWINCHKPNHDQQSNFKATV